MDSISGDSTSDIIQKSLSDIKVKQVQDSATTPEKPLASTPKLDALSNLVNDANTSSNDIRQDVVANAQKLLSDPDWLSDDQLFNLSEKLLQVEDFES